MGLFPEEPQHEHYFEWNFKFCDWCHWKISLKRKLQCTFKCSWIMKSLFKSSGVFRKISQTCPQTQQKHEFSFVQIITASVTASLYESQWSFSLAHYNHFVGRTLWGQAVLAATTVQCFITLKERTLNFILPFSIMENTSVIDQLFSKLALFINSFWQYYKMFLFYFWFWFIDVHWWAPNCRLLKAFD